MKLPTPPLLVITDRLNAAYPLHTIVDAAFMAGGRWVMVREKDLDDAALAALARDVAARGRRYGATVVVNGLAVDGCAGVHLPHGRDVAAMRRRLGKDALLGVSAHSLAEIVAAADAGADYVTLSPIFLTASKPGYGPALGLAGLRAAAAASPIPVIALAGITPDTVADCITMGAAGVAVMGTVMRADDPVATVRRYLEALS
ncbi:MAG: thiamine phosphate synthase [Rhodospirillales bacterium]